MHEALLYQKLKDKKVKCGVCHHSCLILPDKRGICGVRENQNGTLYALNYGKAIAAHVDPIEKKPLYHFLPGTFSYSIATVGCNFRCLHCQNADISQINKQQTTNNKQQILGKKISPEQIIQNALQNNCPSISYTYTEPTIFLEYALDTMKLAKKYSQDSQKIRTNSQLANVWVSNGYMSDKTLDLITPYLDAINVDLKSFSEKFYQKVCGAHLQPVLDNLIKIKKSGIHLEVTTLVIPDQNDSTEELTEIAKFIAEKLGADTAWHISRFFPHYKMAHLPPTPVEKIYQAVEIGKKYGLDHVYAGNV